MSSNSTLSEKRSAFVPAGVSNLTQVFVAKAENATVTDVDGREYIDFVGGIGVNNVGHCHPKVVAAIQKQAASLIHSCFHIAMYEPYVSLAERLAKLTPGNFPKKTLFANSGAEAVENAVKIARYATGRTGIIAFDTAFHGRTLLTMTLTSKVKPYKFGFGPFAPEVYRAPYAYCYRCPYGKEPETCDAYCADKVEDFFINNTAAESVAAILVEPVAGEGGFISPPSLFFQKLADICARHGIVFISDEVQTGIGRTGTLFAMEQHNVEPDITLTAKSLGGGMPISAVVGKSELMDAPHKGGLGGTYGGNPVVCAAAHAVLDVFEEENLLDTAKALGRDVRARLEALAAKTGCIGEVRGLGPMLALEMVKDKETREPDPALTAEVVRQCLDNGLLILSCGNKGNVIRTLMPLTITKAELEKGMAILEAAITAAIVNIKSVCVG